MGSILPGVGTAALGFVKNTLDPLNITGINSPIAGQAPASVTPSFWSGGLQDWIRSTSEAAANADRAAHPPQSPMGVASAAPAPAPQPQSHWSYTPGQGTAWNTPNGSGGWNPTKPGGAPGNRI